MRLPSIALLATAVTALPTIERIESRATQQYGQYQTQYSGNYNLATNGWGWQYGTGFLSVL